MKLLKQKKSLLTTSVILALMSMFSFKCTTNKSSVQPVVIDPGTVVDTTSSPNNSSPNHPGNVAKMDSIKKTQMEKKKRGTKKKSNEKDK